MTLEEQLHHSLSAAEKSVEEQRSLIQKIADVFGVCLSCSEDKRVCVCPSCACGEKATHKAGKSGFRGTDCCVACWRAEWAMDGAA